MSETDELRAAVSGTRSTLKALMRTCRGALGQLADLEERLAALENAKPLEAQRNGSSSTRAFTRTR